MACRLRSTNIVAPFCLLLMSCGLVLANPLSARNTTLGFEVWLVDSTLWKDTRQTLRNLLCVGSVSAGQDCLPGHPNRDLLAVGASHHTKSKHFTVSVNKTWMMYDAIAIPQAVLDEFKIRMVEAVGNVPSLPISRGPNLVQLNTFTLAYPFIVPRVRGWYSFRTIRRDLVKSIGWEEHTNSDFNLVSANYTYDPERKGYEGILVVSMATLSQQAELGGIKWGALMEAYIISRGNVEATHLFPIGINLDQYTTMYLSNRTEFIFNNSKNEYVSFKRFSRGIQFLFSLRGGIRLKTSSWQLVKAEATTVDTFTIQQTYVVSFESAEFQQKAVEYANKGPYGHDGVAYKFYGVKTVLPLGETKNTRGGQEDNGASKPHHDVIVIVAAVVIASVVVVVVIATVAMLRKKQDIIDPISIPLNHELATKRDHA